MQTCVFYLNFDAQPIPRSWSAPIAVGALGLSWGLQIGGAVCDVMIVLMKREALEPFMSEHGTQFKFGPESGVAVGQMGRMAGMSAHSNSYKVARKIRVYTGNVPTYQDVQARIQCL